ncbi:hypothetical protein Hsw_1936 [Hymenobacter swuensis DY53]|uniref:Uncharacterized protein n=1 Tax=Hymenobacter swuensis DY53 TaxID=1227739 RepID=W8F4L5_9BACT|nr:hypothetical protein Hsw_1936 [Hymenobacter swuensis DY53]
MEQLFHSPQACGLAQLSLAMVTPTLMFTVLLLATLAVFSAYLRGTNQHPAA